MNLFMDTLYEHFVIPTLRILFVLGVIFFIVYLLYFLVKKILEWKKFISREKLTQENLLLTTEKEKWQEERDFLLQKIDQLETECRQNPLSAHTQLLHLGNLKIGSNRILYIVPQSLEQTEGGNSRIKIIHYTDTQQTDAIYCTFEEILEKVDSNFMLINKNQLINLREIHKIQGMEVYLKGIKNAFYVSAPKKEEFDLRIANL